MIDRDKIMVAAGRNIMRKTPQEAHDIIENMTQHHFQNSDFIFEKTDIFLSLDSLPPRFDDEIFDAEGDILLFEKLFNIDSKKYPSPQELNDDPEEDILFLETLLKDDPSEAKNSEISSLIREPSDTFLTGSKEIEFTPLEDIDDLLLILRVSKKPLVSLDSISNLVDMIIINPLLDFNSEFTLNLDNPIFVIWYEDGDRSKTKTIMDESHDDGSKREWMAGMSKADELMDRLHHLQADTTKGNACKSPGMTGRPKMISSPLVSHTTTIYMLPRGPFDIDVVATFEVPLTTVYDLQMLINDIEAGKHDELLARMTNDNCEETLDALGTICNSIQANNPIVQSMDVISKLASYAGAAGARAKDQPKVSSNFRPLVDDPFFHGVNISIPRKVVKKLSTRFKHTLYGYFIGKRLTFLVVEYYARNNWGKHGLKRIMMNTKGFFFIKFNSKAGLEAFLESGPWMIHQTLIILKKWSMSTSL
nr:zinc knuckle CX2CX4HX4C [Tanacetum cinerariifolium]